MQSSFFSFWSVQMSRLLFDPAQSKTGTQAQDQQERSVCLRGRYGRYVNQVLPPSGSSCQSNRLIASTFTLIPVIWFKFLNNEGRD